MPQRSAENGVAQPSVRQPLPACGSAYQKLAGSRDSIIQVMAMSSPG
jgi:hypothetical protein